MNNYDLLWMCAWCKRIKDKDGVIFGRDENQEKYDSLIKQYGRRITHSICEEDSKKELENLENYNTK